MYRRSCDALRIDSVGFPSPHKRLQYVVDKSLVCLWELTDALPGIGRYSGVRCEADPETLLDEGGLKVDYVGPGSDHIGLERGDPLPTLLHRPQYLNSDLRVVCNGRQVDAAVLSVTEQNNLDRLLRKADVANPTTSGRNKLRARLGFDCLTGSEQILNLLAHLRREEVEPTRAE